MLVEISRITTGRFPKPRIACSSHAGGIASAFRAIAGRLRAIDRAPFWFRDVEPRGNERGQTVSARPESVPRKVVRSIFEAHYPELLNK